MTIESIFLKELSVEKMVEEFLSKLSEKVRKEVLSEIKKGDLSVGGREALLVVCFSGKTTKLVLFQKKDDGLIKKAFRKKVRADAESLKGSLTFFKRVASDPFQLFIVGMISFEEFVKEILLSGRGRLLSSIYCEKAPFRIKSFLHEETIGVYAEAYLNSSELEIRAKKLALEDRDISFRISGVDFSLLKDRKLFNRALLRLVQSEQPESPSRDDLVKALREEALRELSPKRQRRALL